MAFKSITFAGHSAVFIDTEIGVVAIDPWLEGNPSCPPACRAPEKIDLIVLTHGHADHASEASKWAKELGSKVAATYELATIMKNEGVPEDKIIFMNKGGTVELDGLKVTLTHAMHSSSYDTENGTVYAGEACGVVLHSGDKAIYHAGDTALFSDMELIKEEYEPMIALIPIGDCFTMGPREGARAAELVGADIAIPIHYGTFPLLTGCPKIFKEECQHKGIEGMILAPGESLFID